MDRQRVLADLLRKTADAIDQGTCILTNAQASMIIDELMNRPMSKEQASICLGMGRSSFDKASGRVSELLALAINGRLAKSSNTTV